LITPFEDKYVTKVEDLNRSPEVLRLGNDIIRHGRAGVIILAGGQGSRLGWNHPKGTYILPDLPSGKSIFHILVEKFLAAQKHAGPQVKACTLFIMTSDDNHTETIEHF
jgi:UDP-N-acetylglucosamine/UDP-N-acetylgalactosamine diphosphorylase